MWVDRPREGRTDRVTIALHGSLKEGQRGWTGRHVQVKCNVFTVLLFLLCTVQKTDRQRTERSFLADTFSFFLTFQADLQSTN